MPSTLQILRLASKRVPHAAIRNPRQPSEDHLPQILGCRLHRGRAGIDLLVLGQAYAVTLVPSMVIEGSVAYLLSQRNKAIMSAEGLTQKACDSRLAELVQHPVMTVVEVHERLRISQLFQDHSCDQAPFNAVAQSCARGMYQPTALDALPRPAASCKTRSLTTSSLSAHHH